MRLSHCFGEMASSEIKRVKSIFVTGAASGIGKEVAIRFSKQGWFVGLFDLNEEALRSLGEMIGEERCCYQRLDVTDAIEFEKATETFGKRTSGTMDVLFNCAGVAYNGLFADIPLQKLQKIIRVNVEGTIIGIHACLPLLRRTANARIINMSSASAFYGVPEMAAYSASKAAIRALTEALEIELKQEGIMVSDISPSFVDTPMVTAQSHTVGGIRKLGVRLTAGNIAQVVWNATNEKRLHWVPEWRVSLLQSLTRLVPYSQRLIMKWISGLG